MSKTLLLAFEGTCSAAAAANRVMKKEIFGRDTPLVPVLLAG
jgi:hypothetical protein